MILYNVVRWRQCLFQFVHALCMSALSVAAWAYVGGARALVAYAHNTH